MTARHRHRRQQGQVIPLVALAAVALFAFAALAIDGGLSFNDRRNDQAIADHAAVAGAQKLVSSSPTALEQTAARTRAFEYVQRGLGTWTGAPPAGCVLTINPATCTPAPAYSVTITTPLSAPINGWDPNHLVSVGLSHQLKGTFLGAAGLNSIISIGAPAVAVNQAVLPPPVHVVWATYCPLIPNCTSGGGNTMFVTSPNNSGVAQVDDGTGNCTVPQYDIFSDEKIHAPLNGSNWFNINGFVDLSKFDNDQSRRQVLQHWQSPSISRGSSIDGDPHYAAPTDDISKYVTDPAPSVSGTTVTFSPGRYTKDLVVQPSDPQSSGKRWTNATSFVFLNGVYWFDNHSLTFNMGTYEAHSQDYQTSSGSFGARTGTTDGVEFYLTKGATFFAQGGTINLQAPSQIAQSLRRPLASTTPFITIFVDRNDTTGDTGNTTHPSNEPGGVNNPVAIGTMGISGAPDGYPVGQYFHERGVVYVQNVANGDQKSGAVVAASSTDPNKYAVMGQLVAPYVVLNLGGVSTMRSLVCPANPATIAGKLVQFNSAYVPSGTPGADTVLLQ